MRLLGLIPRDYKDFFGVKIDYNSDIARERLFCASEKSTGIASISKLSQVAYNMHMASTSLAIVAYVYEYPLYRMINQWTQDAIIIHNVAILSLYNPYNTFSATTPIQALQPYMPIQSLVWFVRPNAKEALRFSSSSL